MVNGQGATTLDKPDAVQGPSLSAHPSGAGDPKPLHVRNALTPEEIAKYSVELINVPFGLELEQRTRKLDQMIWVGSPTHPLRQAFQRCATDFFGERLVHRMPKKDPMHELAWR